MKITWFGHSCFFQFKTVFPCHYGAFPIIGQTADAFVAEKGANGLRA